MSIYNNNFILFYVQVVIILSESHLQLELGSLAIATSEVILYMPFLVVRMVNY